MQLKGQGEALKVLGTPGAKAYWETARSLVWQEGRSRHQPPT